MAGPDPSPWNPRQYERFEAERSQPFFDLLALVEPRAGMRVVDLGCGTGKLTRELHRRLAATETLGVDSSATMLADTPALGGGGLSFEQGDLNHFATPGWDLLFSNAALHWVPHHDQLLGRLTGLLTPTGQLAIQVPANFDHPSHTVAAEVAREEPFGSALHGYERGWPILAPEAYAELLDRLGYARQQVRLQVYGHRLGSREEVVEWVKGTLLTDYERRLSPELYARFVARYRERLMEELCDTRPYFFAFKRIILWASRH